MNRTIAVFSKALSFLTMASLSVATAQIKETKIVPENGMPRDEFGYSVSISGNNAFVGAPSDDIDNGQDRGSVFIFHYDGSSWVQAARLIASDGEDSDGFGQSVSVSGLYAIVGADGDDDNGRISGSAYVFFFDGTNWVEVAKLVASDGEEQDRFGTSVSLSGDFALIGATSNGNSGSVYVFQRDGSNWLEQAKLTPLANPRSNFGISVSISGNHALISSFSTNPVIGYSHFFRYDGPNWVEQGEFADTSDSFGRGSVSGEYAIVGAEMDEDNGHDSGAAYVYHYDGMHWVEQAKLIAEDCTFDNSFGWSVSIWGEYALVGAHHDDSGIGSAYIFHYDGSDWVKRAKLTASDDSTNNLFSSRVSISDNRALIGSYFDDDNGTNSGSAYVYEGFNSTSIPCDAITVVKAKCNPDGVGVAIVRISNSVAHSGKTVEFQVDDVIYPVVLVDNGTHTIGRLEVPALGFGLHTLTLVEPPGCFDPIDFVCQAASQENDPALDILWSEFDASFAEGPASKEVPRHTALLGNYPNPFNPSTTFSYTLGEPGRVSLKVYNTLGQLVKTIVDQEQVQGHHEAVWDGRNEAGGIVSSGIYIYRMTAGSYVETKRMLLLK